MRPRLEDRRNFLCAATSVSLVLGASAARVAPIEARLVGGERREEEEENEVSPPEDLMQEHGVLNRLLLVYEECARRIERAGEAPIAAIAHAADVLRRFVEDYHERNEEDHVFPRLVAAGELVDLVGTLKNQHRVGRQMTDRIRLLTQGGGTAGGGLEALVQPMRLYVRMFRPHEAREDTVVFRTFRAIMPHEAYEALGETFEAREHELFGEHGFEDVVAEVAGIEAQLGIEELEKFTARP